MWRLRRCSFEFLKNSGVDSDLANAQEKAATFGSFRLEDIGRPSDKVIPAVLCTAKLSRQNMRASADLCWLEELPSGT